MGVLAERVSETRYLHAIQLALITLQLESFAIDRDLGSGVDLIGNDGFFNSPAAWIRVDVEELSQCLTTFSEVVTGADVTDDSDGGEIAMTHDDSATDYNLRDGFDDLGRNGDERNGLGVKVAIRIAHAELVALVARGADVVAIRAEVGQPIDSDNADPVAVFGLGVFEVVTALTVRSVGMESAVPVDCHRGDESDDTVVLINSDGEFTDLKRFRGHNLKDEG